MTIVTGIRLTADNRGLVAGLGQSETAVERLGRAGAEAQGGLNRAAQASDRLGSESRQAAGGIDAQRQALERSGAAARQGSRRLSAATSRSRNLGFAAQNAAFQLGDMAVQIGGGTSAMRAMSQQLPQLLGGFGLWGAAIGAVVAVAGALAPMLLDIGDSAEKAAGATDALADALDRAEELIGDQAEEVRDLARAYAEAAEAQRLLIEADFTLRMTQIEDGIRQQAQAIRSSADELAADLALRASRLDSGRAQGSIFPGGELNDEQARQLLDALQAFDGGAGVEGLEQLGEAVAALTIELDGTSPAFTQFADQVLEQVRQALDGAQSLEEMRAALTALRNDAAAFADTVDPETAKRANEAARAVEALRERIADLRAEAEITSGGLTEIEGSVLAAARALEEAGVSTDQAAELLETYRFALEQVEIAEARQEARERHRKAVETIGAAYAALLPQLQRSRAEAEAWRAEQLAGLDETAEGYEAYAEKVEAVFQERLADAMDQNLRDSREWRDGIVRALQDYEEAATDAGANAAAAMTGSMRQIEDALVDGVESVSDFVNTLRREFQRAFVRQNITGPLAGFANDLFSSFLPGLFGGGGGGGSASNSVAVLHAGGLVGAPAPTRRVARVGEEVLTEADPRHRNNLRRGGAAPTGPLVVIEDRRGADAPPVRQTAERGPDGRLQIRAIVQAEVRDGLERGAYDSTLQRNFAINRQPRGGL